LQEIQTGPNPGQFNPDHSLNQASLMEIKA